MKLGWTPASTPSAWSASSHGLPTAALPAAHPVHCEAGAVLRTGCLGSPALGKGPTQRGAGAAAAAAVEPLQLPVLQRLAQAQGEQPLHATTAHLKLLVALRAGRVQTAPVPTEQQRWGHIMAA